MSIVDERKDRKASKRCPKAHHMKYSMTTDEQELMKTGSDPNRLDRHERGDLLMRTLTELPAEISDFLLTVALGNSEPDNLAMDAVELLEAFGVKMTKITKGQYVEKR